MKFELNFSLTHFLGAAAARRSLKRYHCVRRALLAFIIRRKHVQTLFQQL